jgi:hypothetical protein
MKTKNSFILVLLAGVFALSYLFSCKKLDVVTATTTDLNI